MNRGLPPPENDSGATPRIRECACLWTDPDGYRLLEDLGKSGLIFGLGLGQTDHSLTGLELTALLEKFNALEALQHTALGCNGARSFKAGMLTHGSERMKV